MKKNIFVVLLVLQFIVLAACGSEQASLRLANRSDIAAVSLYYDSKSETITDSKEIDRLFAELSAVSNKVKESYNDIPTTDGYLKIVFKLTEERSTEPVYVFKDDAGFYVEQAYNGIFSIDEECYSTLLGFALGM